MRIFILIFFGLFLLQSCKPAGDIQQNMSMPTAENIANEKDRLRKVAYMNVGRFSNAKDTAAVNNPYVQEQIVSGTPIWQNRSDAYWVHFQWTLADFPEQPVANMILKFTQVAPDTILVQTISAPTLKPNFDELRPRDLNISEACSYRIAREKKNQFRILYNEQHCLVSKESSPLPYFDISAVLKPNAIIYHTRFYDANKNLKMEYPGYRYERIPAPLDK